MPDLEAEMERLRGASALATLDLLQGYWRCPLAQNIQNVLTAATLKELSTLTRVPRRILNARAYFQAASDATQVGEAELYGVVG